MPPTGHPGLPRPGIFVHSRMPDGVRHPDGGTNRRSRRNPGQDDPDAADVLDLDSWLCREFCDVLRIVSFAAEMRRLRLVLAM
jgi:hypothetical protein